MRNYFLTSIFLFQTLLGSVGHAQTKSMQEFWRAFAENPTLAMDLNPPKSKNAKSLFPQHLIDDNSFVTIKDQFRTQKLCQKNDSRCSGVHFFSGSPDRNNLKTFLENKNYIMNIKKMTEQNLHSGRVSQDPWSGDYWGTYKGGIGARYESESQPSSSDYLEHKKHFALFWPLNLTSQEYLDQLSPAEKYDLAVGDSLMTLTNYSWSEAEEAYAAHGEVPTWFGICHGWAAAAFMFPRPTSVASIPVPNSDLKINFYPDDLKALSTLLWANSNHGAYFVGGRCNDKDPKKDENGRIISEQCFDTNPGSWHVAVVNKIGLDKKSFVLDATYDHEVWNQPAHSYEYRFFNPETKEEFNNIDEAKIAIEEYKSDNFRKHRFHKTRQIVGVYMDLTYVIERAANHNYINTSKDDYHTTVTYIYDLELDSDLNILGGEWYQNKHPDMLWTPLADTKAQSPYESLAQTTWDISQTAAPQDWTQAAQRSSKIGMPLLKVIELLMAQTQ